MQRTIPYKNNNSVALMLQQIFLLTFTFFFFIVPTHAMEIEIKGGYQSATPIAIVPFSWGEDPQAPVDIAKVIRADLSRSGLFSPLKLNELPERPAYGDNVDYTRWKSTLAEQLGLGAIKPIGKNQYEVTFQLLDIFSGQKVFSYRNAVDRKNLRRIAHQISDKIYEKLVHERGAFDTLIAYVVVNNNSDQKNRTYTLAIADSDGFAEKVILKSKKPIMSPAWSPNGKRLAYVSFEKNRSVIYIQELKTGKRQAIAKFKGINSGPRWSPDGKRLAMTLSKDGNSEIYIMHLASGVLQRITNHYGIDTEAAWAPNGQSLVFTSDRGGKPQIYQVAVNQNGRAGHPKRITHEGNYNSRASFSPDGKELILVHRNDGHYRIAKLDMSSRQLNVLTRSKLDESPSFAPNGKLVLYATELHGRGILEAVVVAGSQSPQRLRVLSGDVREPAWSPYRNP